MTPIYRANGSLDDWKSSVASRAVGNSRLTLALSTAFVGPLISMTTEEFSAFHFVGDSSTGKSTAVALAGSVWGLPNKHDQIRSWRGTDNGLEGVATETNDTLLILDEMGQAEPRVVGEITYMIANGAGKARATRDGSAREVKTWHASVLSTGEATVETVLRSINRATPGGIDVRMINIPADAGRGMGMFETLHATSSAKEFADATKAASLAAYGTAGVRFIELLISMAADGEASIESYIRTRMQAFAAKHMPANAGQQVGRVLNKFALAAAAGELAIVFEILPWSTGAAETGAATCFAAWLAQRGNNGSKESADLIARFRSTISEHGDSRFVDLCAEEESKTMIVRDRIGWRDEDTYYFAADAFGKIASPMGSTAAAKILLDAKLCKSATVQKRKFGTPARVNYYAITAEILERS